MPDNEIVVHGQVSPDGILVLDAHVGLPVGPVEVVIRPVPTPQPGTEDWWQFLQRAHAELERSGHRFRSKEEIDADIESLRSDDERIDDTRRQSDPHSPH